MTYGLLIVDDEQLARNRLRRLLEQDQQYQVLGEANNGMQAIDQVSKLKPDIVLMDIRMPGMDGLEAARHLSKLEQPPAVIFCTAYGEHALDAFEVDASAYLLKPVRPDDLSKALTRSHRINKAQLQSQTDQVADDATVRNYISAKTRRGLTLVPVHEIAYFQADQKYVTAHYDEGELLIDDTLKELEQEFSNRFVRIHRNALVAVDHIESLGRDAQGHSFVRVRDAEVQLPVSRRLLSELKTRLHSA